MIYLLKGFEQKVMTPAYLPHVSVKMQDLEALSDTLEHPFHFDIRYARHDNFFGRAVYAQASAFALQHVASDLARVHRDLNREGLGLLIFDAYRPWSVSKLFYDECKPEQRDFLADPARGSSHNRGCAIDLSMYFIEDGQPVQMPSEFDEMNERAWVEYRGGEAEARRLRDLLQSAMRAHRFTGIRMEWWHFNHTSHQQWPVMDLRFEEILQAPMAP